MQKQLTTGPVMPTMLQFAVPMILGDLLQQCYNIADTLIVGRFIGTGALAAVGSAFTLMTFLTSILLGLAMGSGTVFSIKYGQKDDAGLKEGILASFVLLAGVTAVLCCKILPMLAAGQLRRVLFMATGALMSQTTFLQGESIPGIAHCVELGGAV